MGPISTFIKNKYTVPPLHKPYNQIFRLSEYGHSVARVLREDTTNWNSYNLATLYWRMKGDAFESIECVRWPSAVLFFIVMCNLS